MAYTNSSLVTYTKISPNKTSPRNHAIDCITIHCVVGQWSAKTIGDFFANSSVEASCNYGVGYDGSIALCVEEKDRSWCSSNRDNDNRAITIEVASDTTHPYAVTDKALSTLIELIADICRRNNIKELKWKGDKSLIGQVDKQNMTVHRWFDNKACPGDYLYSRHSYIAEQVNKKLGASVVVTPSSPSTSSELKEGDIVNFAGGKHYSSANAIIGRNVKASKAKITNVCKSSKHPYHIRAINDNGDFVGGGVYGWVDASTVSAIGINVETKTPDVVYQVYADGKWWGEIINYNEIDSNGYAGVFGKEISGIRVKLSNGKMVTVRSHASKNARNNWFSEITKWDNTDYGYSGCKGVATDCIAMKADGCTLEYRVHVNGGNWLSWISKYDINDYDDGLAGIYGKPIDAVQIRVI